MLVFQLVMIVLFAEACLLPIFVISTSYSMKYARVERLSLPRMTLGSPIDCSIGQCAVACNALARDQCHGFAFQATAAKTGTGSCQPVSLASPGNLVMSGSTRLYILEDLCSPDHSPCLNAATCNMSGWPDTLCKCIPDFNGTYCEIGPSKAIVQQHDGMQFFDRTWAEFKIGFGNVVSNYWIGNDRLHELTKNGQYKLRVDLQSLYNGQWYWAEYSTFIVDSETKNYTLHVSGYSGTAGNSMSDINGMQFTTVDRDNDLYQSTNCAVWGHGGFWYRACSNADINSKYAGGCWGFNWYYLPVGSSYCDHNLQASRMTVLLK